VVAEDGLDWGEEIVGGELAVGVAAGPKGFEAEAVAGIFDF
jgi:hypothetical protein